MIHARCFLLCDGSNSQQPAVPAVCTTLSARGWDILYFFIDGRVCVRSYRKSRDSFFSGEIRSEPCCVSSRVSFVVVVQ